MQLFNLIVLAGAASAAAIQERATNYFYVGDFDARHIAHSSDSRVGFDLTDQSSGVFSRCEGSKVTKYADNLGTYRDYTCTNKGGVWSLYENDDGAYELSITNPAGITGTKVFADNALQYYNSSPGFRYQYLNVPKRFKIKYD